MLFLLVWSWGEMGDSLMVACDLAAAIGIG